MMINSKQVTSRILQRPPQRLQTALDLTIVHKKQLTQRSLLTLLALKDARPLHSTFPRNPMRPAASV